MVYRLSADLVLFAHFLFAVFAVFGGLLVFYEPAWAWVHIPVVLWSSVVNLMSWTCPLTSIENVLRTRAGQLGYSGGLYNTTSDPLFTRVACRDNWNSWPVCPLWREMCWYTQSFLCWLYGDLVPTLGIRVYEKDLPGGDEHKGDSPQKVFFLLSGIVC